MSSQHRRRVALFATTLIFCALGSAAAQGPAALRPATADEASAGPDDVDRAQGGATGGEAPAPDAPAPLDDAALSEALKFEDFAASVKSKTAKALGRAANSDITWTRSDAADGSSSYSVKQTLGTVWDSHFGADFSVPPSTVPSPLASSSGNGSAWANVDVPDVATLGLRAEPSADGNKVGSSLQRTMPVGSNYGVTLQSSVAVTDLYASLGSPGPMATIYDTDNSVKFSIRSTGTAFSAGRLTSSIDPATHTRLTAEQNIYGPLNVTGSLYDPGKATSSTSIGAGLKFDW